MHARPRNRTAQWRAAAPRRAVSIPVLFLTSLLVVVLSPVLVVLLAAGDLLLGWRRRRLLRLGVMAASYLFYEAGGVVRAGLLWFPTLGGRRALRPWSIEAHRKLQAWWANGLLRAIGRTMRLELEYEGLEVARPGPIIVAGRHISFGDALLPSALVGGHMRMPVRHVLKHDLAWDPCLDVVGHRMINTFVDREGSRGGDELGPVRDLAVGIDDNTALVIFPEGTFRNEDRHQRAVARIAARDPELAAIAAKMRHLLPPRPGGTLALMAGAPDADLVLYAHTGFEEFSSFAAIMRNVPFRDPVHVRFWRFDRAGVPTDEAGATRWLFDRWLELDDWVEARHQATRATRTTDRATATATEEATQ